jgi:hypothetical protein
MSAETNIGRYGHRGFVTGAKVVAWSLMLIVCGYGIVDMPELWTTLSIGLRAFPSTDQTPAGASRTDVTTPAVSARDRRAPRLGERGGTAGASRECPPEKGNSNACVRN